MPAVSIYQPKVRGKKITVWWMAWRNGGKLYRVSTKSRNRSVAKSIAKAHEDALVLSPLGLTKMLKPDIVAWDEGVAKWLTEVEARNRPATRESYATSLANYKAAMGPTSLADITTSTLEQYAVKRISSIDNKVTAETVNRDLRSIRVFVRWCKRHGHRHDLPEFDRAFVREDVRRPTTVSVDTIEKILKALPNAKYKARPQGWWNLLLQLMIGTGCRTGEALGLTWAKVDLDKAQVTFAAQTSKGRKDRAVPISQSLVELLRAWKGDGVGEVLPWDAKDHKGRPCRRQLYREWARICKTAKVVQPKFKHFRSTRGSTLVASGASLSVVQTFLGHSSPTVTAKHYVDSVPLLRSALDKADGETGGQA